MRTPPPRPVEPTPEPVEPPPEPAPPTPTPAPASSGTTGQPFAPPSVSIPGRVIAILAGVAVLFFLGVSCSAIQGNDARIGDLDAGWAEALNDLIGRKPAVEVDDLSTGQATCLQGNELQIAPGGACGYFIQPYDRAVRSLNLRLTSGQNATVAVQQGEFSDSATLTGGSPTAEFDVLPDEGGTLTITCASFNPCIVTVQ